MGVGSEYLTASATACAQVCVCHSLLQPATACNSLQLPASMTQPATAGQPATA